MNRFKRLFVLALTTICLSLLGHAYILYRFFKDGLLFTGPNDGIEQMVPIQMFLYRKWSEGTFFYATDFGLGGDFFTDLSYYFSTNILFIINASFIWLFVQFNALQTNDVMFWMTNALVVSIIKSALIIIVTFLYARYLKLNHVTAMLFAFLFATSPIYYRFTVYWPFFSDVFILLPLLFLSIERYLKSGKIGLFMIVTALTFINNFYFAYYQVLAGLIYFTIRILWRHHYDIVQRFRSVWTLLVAAILGVGMSLFMFFHGARSFFNNKRIPFNSEIPILESLNHNTNIFFDNYLIVVLFITVQALLTFKLYRYFYFRLFAILSILAIISSFLPYVDHIFNGFSAPQKRWHYLLAFSTSGLIALYVHYFLSLTKRTYILTSIPSMLIIIVSAILYKTFVIWLLWVPIVFIAGLVVLVLKHTRNRPNHLLTNCYSISIAVLMLLVSTVFTKNQIFHEDHEARANQDYIHKSLYNTPLQNELVNDMKQSKNTDERIDWRVNEQDNTPMYQNFKGLSLYSSIFDQELINLYYDHLMINLKEESVSRYQSTGGRANIASLLSVRYQMLKSYQDNLPDYFKLVRKSGQYRIYENEQMLPAVRVTNQYYDARELHTPIDREHAMIDGVILNHEGRPYQKTVKNLLKDTQVKAVNANWNGHQSIHIKKSTNSGITLHIPKLLQKEYDDFYVTLFVKRGAPDSNSTITVNGYQNHRLFNDSKYKTGQHHLLYRTKPNQNGDIHINLSPSGTYQFELKGLYGEDYQTLKQADKRKLYTYRESHSKINIQLRNHSKGIAVINIPYRDGMKATVDGKSAPVKKVNYFMTGVPVNSNDKTIEISYRPPFFFLMIMLSLLSAFIGYLFRRWIFQNK
ncbi:YfhO family protein [Staphylococcus felis]|uniref:YfhO family protein n=1 Tax=Staphylococcus felis TaxID=46127 RepID=UPI003966F035